MSDPASGGLAARVVIFHSLDHARAALAAAAGTRTPLVLRTAPGAAAYAGVGYLAAIIARARAEAPDAPVRAEIDCGDDPGLALAALRAGWTALRLSGRAEVRRKIAEIAAARGAALVADEPGAPVLDLLDARDPAAACRAFFGSARE